MIDYVNILWALLWFAILGGVLGGSLALASRLMSVKNDARTESLRDALPGANCGACGYTGCSAYATAVAAGEAEPNRCAAGGNEVAAKLARIMGVRAAEVKRMRAQVMCSGVTSVAKKKYVYSGLGDCFAAEKLGGGDKICPNGCIGLGTCAAHCPFGAISVTDGVAAVDYLKCRGCGVCVDSCPKHIIKLVPFNSNVWVGCKSVDKGAVTRAYCDAGCISCRLCERGCEYGAISVNDFVASIDYEKCVGCGKCVAACPRKIIHVGKSRVSVSETRDI